MSPQPPDPELSKRALDVAEFWAKALGVVLALYQLLERVAKPFARWRREQRAHQIRSVLEPELKALRDLAAFMPEILEGQTKILERQNETFEELDLFLQLARDSHERHDETNGLLDAMGLASERRDPERRREMTAVLDHLNERRLARRRRMDT